MKCVALGGGVLVLSLVAPMGGALLVRNLIRVYFRRRSFEKKRFLNDLKSLRERSLVEYHESRDGTVRITFTKAGKEKMLEYRVDEMKLKRPEKWDKKWRLVMFDIPSDHKEARDALRRKLKRLEFYPMQKSVYLTPYPCEDEIEFLAALFDVRRYILVLYASGFESEEKLKRHFDL